MELFILSYTFSHVCRTELFKKELIRVGMTEKLMKKRGKVKRKKTRKAGKKGQFIVFRHGCESVA